MFILFFGDEENHSHGPPSLPVPFFFLFPPLHNCVSKDLETISCTTQVEQWRFFSFAIGLQSSTGSGWKPPLLLSNQQFFIAFGDFISCSVNLCSLGFWLLLIVVLHTCFTLYYKVKFNNPGKKSELQSGASYGKITMFISFETKL